MAGKEIGRNGEKRGEGEREKQQHKISVERSDSNESAVTTTMFDEETIVENGKKAPGKGAKVPNGIFRQDW